MKNILVKVISKKPRMYKGIPRVDGRIFINDFWETFEMQLGWWSQADYERQWKEGLERIKTHDTSCLVTAIQDPNVGPFINWWLLYKEDNKIFIRNYILFREYYDERIGNNPFTVDNCYDFIWPRGPRILANGLQVSEWVVDVEG